MKREVWIHCATLSVNLETGKRGKRALFDISRGKAICAYIYIYIYIRFFPKGLRRSSSRPTFQSLGFRENRAPYLRPGVVNKRSVTAGTKSAAFPGIISPCRFRDRSPLSRPARNPPAFNYVFDRKVEIIGERSIACISRTLSCTRTASRSGNEGGSRWTTNPFYAHTVDEASDRRYRRVRSSVRGWLGRRGTCRAVSNFFVSTPLDTRRRESVAASPDGYPSVLFGSGEETGGDRWMENLIETMARSLRGFYRRGNALSGSSAAGMLVFLFVAQPGGW